MLLPPAMRRRRPLTTSRQRQHDMRREPIHSHTRDYWRDYYSRLNVLRFRYPHLPVRELHLKSLPFSETPAAPPPAPEPKPRFGCGDFMASLNKERTWQGQLNGLKLIWRCCASTMRLMAEGAGAQPQATYSYRYLPVADGVSISRFETLWAPTRFISRTGSNPIKSMVWLLPVPGPVPVADR